MAGGRDKQSAIAICYDSLVRGKSMSMKLGARNNKQDMARIQAIHDHAQGLGAQCKGDMDEGKSLKSVPAVFYQCQSTIAQCIDCIRQCETCPNNGDAMHQDCIAKCKDCIVACAMCLDDCSSMEASSAQCVESCQECAEACAACMAACKACTCPMCLEECQECYDACDECAEACNENAGIEQGAEHEAGEMAGMDKSYYFKASSNADDYLIVEDKEKPTTWHLQVRTNGKPNHGLMGSAWAALHEGFRGNTYEGPDKQQAIDKLKALYKQEKMDVPGSGKSYGGKLLSVNYLKSIHIPHAEQFFKDVLAAKFIGKNEIEHAVYVWGTPEQVDLETDFFTSAKSTLGATDFWDRYVGTPRALTWNHAQDKHWLKGNQIIGDTEGYRDSDVARFAQSVLERSHEYRKAIDELIGQRVLGSSSDSAPQYVERVRQKNGSNWIKTWPWFATALTDVPCEYRTIDIGSPYWKSIGVDFKLLQSRIAEAGLETPRGEIANLEQTLTEFQLFDLQQSLAK